MARHAPSYYAATANDERARPRLEGAVEADVVVVGGGFTGLSAARERTQSCRSRGAQASLIFTVFNGLTVGPADVSMVVGIDEFGTRAAPTPAANPPPPALAPCPPHGDPEAAPTRRVPPKTAGLGPDETRAASAAVSWTTRSRGCGFSVGAAAPAEQRAAGGESGSGLGSFPGRMTRFTPLAADFAAAETRIVAELLAVQGKPVDLGGYYRPDPAKATAALRPSPTFNAILDTI